MPTSAVRPPAAAEAVAPPTPAPGLARRVLGLAWPVLALNFLILSVDLSDRFLVGNLPSPTPHEAQAKLAAQGTAHYVAWFISSYTALVSVGATALVARCVGAGDWRTARRATGQAVVLAGLVGLAGAVAGLAYLPQLVQLMGLEGDAAEYATAYLRPMFGLLAFRVIEVGGVACLIGAGDTRTGLWVQGGVAVTNVPLAWLLCRGLPALTAVGFPGWDGLGFVGVPLGTAICYVLAAGAVLAVLMRGRAGLKLHGGDLTPDPALIYRLLRVSMPAAADSLSTVGGQFWFLHIVNALGVAAASAHGIAIGWEALGYLSGQAFGTAAMALVGQNLGARQPQQAARSGWTAFALGCAVMSAMGIVFFVLAPEMFRVFCQDPQQHEVIDAGKQVLRLVAFAMPALASAMIFTAALRGAGDTRVPVLFTWVGFLAVRIPLAYLLTGPAFDLGLFGAWVAMAADLYVRGAFFLWRFAGGRWQFARV
ncbi:MAG TPA: MATE family efflux transporter [Gemmataceae bacterium]|jgi:putative MATE family efflux protein